MEKQSFVVKIAGAAGEGIMTTGLLLSKTIARHGWYVFDYPEYPSLIRGGHNTYQICASKNPVYCQSAKSDVLVAINKEGLDLHQNEMSENAVVFYDKENDKVDISNYSFRAKTIDLPMVKLAEDAGGKDIMGNNVALGACIYILGLDLVVCDQVIADIFADKPSEIIKLNQKAAAAGYGFLKTQTKPLLSVAKQDFHFLTMTGNEAIALGALAGGLQFYAAYPMTPSSSILHFLAEKANSAKIVVKHAEDEISAVNMALGASYVGVRSMVGTSGGGFCYMVEGLGLSGICELPLVVVEAMRPGPALGMPTWTAQGDLKFIVDASHGEFPRFVLAPGDGLEAFELTRKSLELAEKYQVPVILVSDKYLSESRYCFELDKKSFENSRFGFQKSPAPDKTGLYPRYQLNNSRIGNRTVPGTSQGEYVANSYFHEEHGLSTEDSNICKLELDKNFKKLEKMRQEIPEQFWQSDPKAEITFISFGSTKGVVQQAKDELKDLGIAINMLNLSWLWPFPKEQVEQVIKGSKNVVIVEGNIGGQLAQLIASQTGFIAKNRINRYDGRPFYSEEIVDFVKNFKA